MLRPEHRLRIEEVVIPEHFESRALGSLDLRTPNYVVLAVRAHHDWIFNPSEDFELRAGFTLVAMATPHGRQELEAALASAK